MTADNLVDLMVVKMEEMWAAMLAILMVERSDIQLADWMADYSAVRMVA